MVVNGSLIWKNGCWYKLRKEPGVQRALEQTAKRIAAACNREAGTDEFKISSQQGQKRNKGRWRATVITAGRHAARHNAKHNTLIRNMKREGKWQ